MNHARCLTKSRFKLGCECPAKLYYSDRRDEYHDLTTDDTFLHGLAEGGYQVGEFAHWMLCNDPRADVVETLDREEALAETARRMARENVTIAEAAFRHGDLFIRADVVVKQGNLLKLYEVKSKSRKAGDDFWSARGEHRPKAEWEPYLLDIAFQKHVVTQACPGLSVQAFLVLVDKGKLASVDGLNRMFPVVRDGHRITVRSSVTRREELGDDVLDYMNVDHDIAMITELPFDLPRGGSGSFLDLIDQLADIYMRDERCFCALGRKCRECQYRLPSDRLLADALRLKGVRSGRDECWAHAIGAGYDPAKPKVIEIWKYSGADDRIREGRLFVGDLSRSDLGNGACAPRQWLQVDKVIRNDATPWIDRAGLAACMRTWRFPLHFIDFETANMALPARRGMHPYTTVAFQFSHHAVAADGRVTHAGQWIEVRPGEFPSFEFVRALKRDLEGDNGTIFRYAPHENTVLRHVQAQLQAGGEEDRHELIAWISGITQFKPEGGKKEDTIRGPRNMVDMREVVLDFHYDPATRGSNSLKAVLPATIASSDWLRTRYGRPIGQSGIHSLNQPPDWVWVRSECGNDPYAALPPVFTDTADGDLSDFARGLEDVDDGGAATIAYAKLQFFQMPDHERQAIRDALLRYCELDTLAMVMLYEYWRESTRGG